MGCTFSQQNQTPSLKRLKGNKVIHVATLNYCGILKSPFQFYSGKFNQTLRKLSQIFEKLKPQYVNVSNQQPFSWQFSKLDKKIKEQRYSPIYNINAGIEDSKFISKKRFIQLWQGALQKVENKLTLQTTSLEKQEALKFDMLAFHTFLYYVYEVDDIDKMENKDPKKYLDTFLPLFEQAFLDEEKKMKKFKQGLQNTLTDIIFIQEGSEYLRKKLQQNSRYHVEVSPDQDTLICLKKDRFKTITSLRFLTSLFSQEEIALLDWNNHSTILVVDKIILISGHLSSSKKTNAENLQTLKKGFKMLRQKHPDYDIICGSDLNSFVKQFNDQIHIYPNNQEACTSLKKRTSMQTQSNKAEVISKQSKDAILTTFPILAGQISTINFTPPNDSTYLPDDFHPFDHFLLLAQINSQKIVPSQNSRMQ